MIIAAESFGNVLWECYFGVKRSVNLTSIIYKYSQMATGIKLVDFGCRITKMPRYEKESSLALLPLSILPLLLLLLE